jgi:hypothetical protein
VSCVAGEACCGAADIPRSNDDVGTPFRTINSSLPSRNDVTGQSQSYQNLARQLLAFPSLRSRVIKTTAFFLHVPAGLFFLPPLKLGIIQSRLSLYQLISTTCAKIKKVPTNFTRISRATWGPLKYQRSTRRLFMTSQEVFRLKLRKWTLLSLALVRSS